jgi:hypothetical protein
VNVIRIAAILGLVLASGAAHAQSPPRPSDVLLGLGGYCWEADLGEGVTDTHCFSVARGGHLVMDVHKVRSRGGGAVYEGVTLYRVEPATGMVRYDYYNSNGDLMTGYAERDGARIRFTSAPGQSADLVWYLDADAYEVGTASATGAKTKFVKIGPAPEGGF